MIPYVTIPHAMGERFAERLLAFAVEHRDTAEAGAVLDPLTPGGRVDKSVRDVLTIDKLGGLGKELLAVVDGLLPDVRANLGLKRFVVSGKQVSLLAYGDGAFYARHVDIRQNVRAGEAMRQVTFVYYFHREPKSFTGGALRLYDLLGSQSIDLEPQNDTLIAFPSWMPHEVLPVSCPGESFADRRFAVNVWVVGA